MDWDKQCRTCLSEDDGCISVFTQENIKDEEVLLAKIIHQLTGLEVFEYDGLPSVICQDCHDTILQAYSFRQQSLVMNTFLRSKLKLIKIEIEPLEFEQIDLFPQKYENFDAEELQAHGSLTPVDMHMEITNDPNGVSIALNHIRKKKPRISLKRKESTISADEYTAPTNGNKDWKCNTCDKSFRFRKYVKQHIGRVHKQWPYNGTEPKLRLCNICGETFQYGPVFVSHYRKHFPEKCHRCPYCDKLFADKFQCTLHERRHTGEKPFKCQFCDYRCSQNSSLKVHTRIHTGENPFACDYCDKTFKTSTRRIIHTRVNHTKEKPHQCRQCNKTFITTSSLKEHQLVHSDEKSYKCEFCEKEFRFRKNWKVHLMTHTGQRPHVCEICGAGFIQLHSLRTHLLTHNE